MGGILFHGTSADRLTRIQQDGTIRKAPYGVQAVSMTEDPTVALYFAQLAADADRSTPVLLAIDADRLRADGFTLERFSDPVWGERECAWERETVCWADVPLEYARHTLPRPVRAGA